jgi:hypothetical protein
MTRFSIYTHTPRASTGSGNYRYQICRTARQDSGIWKPQVKLHDKERRATLRRRCVVWPTPRSLPRFRQGRSPPSCYYAGHQLNLRLVATHCDLSAMWSDRYMQQLLSPSSLDAAVITAASSDFCVPFGGRLLCTSRRIYSRVASPAVTSVGTICVQPRAVVHDVS